MPAACVVCGQPCRGKAEVCSRECLRARSRAAQRQFRERQRGGPRRCVVCDAEITAPTATNTCSPDCRRAHRLGVPLDRLPPLVPLASAAVCDVCGRKFTPWRPRQKGCSPACMVAGRLRRKLAVTRKGPYPLRPCRVCGRQFAPARKNQVVCPADVCRVQDKRNRALARARGELEPAGDTTICCLMCGREVVAHHNSVLCGWRECFLARQRQVGRARLGILPCACIVCGERFWPPHAGQHYTCSPACQRIALTRRRRRVYENHRDERLAEQSRRMRDDPAYRARRQEIDREYRRRRAALQLEIDAAALAARLEESDRAKD